MKRFLFWILAIVCCGIFSACASSDALPADTTAVAVPIGTLPAGTNSILVPPTLSPLELTQGAPSAASDFVEVTLQNQSSWNVCYVFIAPPDETTWGKDWLGENQLIEPDTTFKIEIKPGTYDVRAENCDYMRLDEQYQVQLTSAWNWKVNDSLIDFTDLFRDSNNWSIKGSGAAGQIRSNAYYLSTTQKSTLATVRAGQDFVDRIMTVEARPVAPADVSKVAYGLMCRVQSNGDGYLFLARGDGMYSIQTVTSGDMSPLVDWKASDQVFSGSKLNVIEITCNQDKLALRLNGRTVDKITDARFSSGDVALSAIQQGEGSAEVQFDNLVVTTP